MNCELGYQCPSLEVPTPKRSCTESAGVDAACGGCLWLWGHRKPLQRTFPSRGWLKAGPSPTPYKRFMELCRLPRTRHGLSCLPPLVTSLLLGCYQPSGQRFSQSDIKGMGLGFGLTQLLSFNIYSGSLILATSRDIYTEGHIRMGRAREEPNSFCFYTIFNQLMCCLL